MTAELGATTSPLLNRLAYQTYNAASALTSVASDDRTIVSDTSADGASKYVVPGDLWAAANYSFIAGGTALTVTAALHAGRIIKLDTVTGTTCTLPAASGTGNRYRFVISVIATSNSHVIKVANVNDTMVGLIWSMSDDPATVKAFKASGTDDTITLNRTTTGSVIIGEDIEIIDFAANVFLVRGWTASSGTEATPFSATV